MKELKPYFFLLLTGLFLFSACDKKEDNNPYTERKLSYPLEISACDTETPCAFVDGGARGYIDVKELKAGGIEIGVYLDGTLDGAQHPVHLHEGALAEGGNMVAMLSPLEDVGSQQAESITKLEVLGSDGSEMSFDRFAAYDGVIKVHLDDGEYKKVVIASANIGSNAP